MTLCNAEGCCTYYRTALLLYQLLVKLKFKTQICPSRCNIPLSMDMDGSFIIRCWTNLDKKERSSYEEWKSKVTYLHFKNHIWSPSRVCTHYLQAAVAVVVHLSYFLLLRSQLVFDSYYLGQIKCAPLLLLRFCGTTPFLLCHPSVTAVFGIIRAPVKERVLQL